MPCFREVMDPRGRLIVSQKVTESPDGTRGFLKGTTDGITSIVGILTRNLRVGQVVSVVKGKKEGVINE